MRVRLMRAGLTMVGYMAPTREDSGWGSTYPKQSFKIAKLKI